MAVSSAARFWEAFSAEAGQLREWIRAGQLRPAFHRIETLLEDHGYGFAFDVTESDEKAVLVLTPEGDPAVGEEIDSVLRERPPIDGWNFLGRRQKKPLHDAYVFVKRIYGRDVSDAVFTAESKGQRWRVRLFSRGVQGLPPDVRSGLAATFLDHAMGEEQAMRKLAELDAEEGPAPSSAIPAASLIELLS